MSGARSGGARVAHLARVVAAAGLAAALAAGPGGAFGAVATITPSKDSTLYENDGTRSNGAGVTFFAGKTGVFGSRRAVIAFDLASRIPPGSTITSASLTVHVSQNTSGAHPVALHRLLADWGESASNAGNPGGAGAPAAPGDATWTHAFYPDVTWSRPGGDFAAAPSGGALIGGIGFYTVPSTAALVADVQAWLDHPGTSYGWILVGDETAPGPSAVRYDSKESASGASVPVLAVGFVPPGAVTLTVTTAGSGAGTVTSAPAGIGCGSDCAEAYASGTLVTLTAAPAAGSTFAGWQGGGCSGTDPCPVTVTASTTVTAIFAVAGRAVITAPADGSRFPLAAPTPVTFAWTALPGTAQYGFEFTGPDRQFANPNGTAPDPVNGLGGAGGGFAVTGTSVTTVLDAASPSGSYQVRVVGLTPTGEITGSFSDAVTLLLGTAAVPPSARPTIAAPVTGSTLQRGAAATFAWSAIEGVGQYLVEFTGPDRQFANPNGTGPDGVNGLGGAGGGLPVAGTALTVVVPSTIPAATYQVRVIGRGPTGQLVGSFSDAVRVVVQ